VGVNPEDSKRATLQYVQPQHKNPLRVRKAERILVGTAGRLWVHYVRPKFKGLQGDELLYREFFKQMKHEERTILMKS
jgi:hypothetical protein